MENNPYKEMINDILPGLIENFYNKSGDYGPAGFVDLGIKGQFSDMWRKMVKLKRSLWDGFELRYEDVDEIMSDLFGHLMISLYLLRVPSQPEPKVAQDPLYGYGSWLPTTEEVADAQESRGAIALTTKWDDTGRCQVRDLHGRRCVYVEGHDGLDEF